MTHQATAACHSNRELVHIAMYAHIARSRLKQSHDCVIANVFTPKPMVNGVYFMFMKCGDQGRVISAYRITGLKTGY